MKCSLTSPFLFHYELNESVLSGGFVLILILRLTLGSLNNLGIKAKTPIVATIVSVKNKKLS